MPSSVFIPQLKPGFWRTLYYFYYVASFRSYSKAALALNITRPFLSRAIQSLEQRLHTPLLVRTTRQVSLTPEGLYVLRLAKHLFGTLKKIDRIIQSKTLSGGAVMSLFIPECLLVDYCLEPLRAFGLKHPDLSLRIYPAHDLEQALPSKHVIKIHLGFEEGSIWVQKPLWCFEGALYASPGYVKKEGPVRLDNLSEHRLLLLHTTMPGMFEDMNWHAHLQTQDVFDQPSECVVHSPEHLIKMAEADFGIMAWIKNHPALKGCALSEVLEEVSRVHAPQRYSYFSCTASSFASEEVQALYLYLSQHALGIQEGSKDWCPER